MSPKEGADKEFLSEAEELIETLGKELLRYEEALQSPGRINPDILNGIFRAAHSLKGLAGMFGYVELGRIAHSMENLLDRMRLGKVKSEPAVLDTIFSGIECLKGLLSGADEEIEKAKGAVERIEMAAEGKLPEVETTPRKSPAPETVECADDDMVIFEGVPLPRQMLDVLTEYEEFRLLENIRSGTNIIKVHAAFNIKTFDVDLPRIMDWLKERGEIITTLPGGGDSDGTRIHFDLLVGMDLPIESIKPEIERIGYALSVIRAKGTAPQPERKPAEAQQEKPAARKSGQMEKDEEGEQNGADSEAETESARSVSNTVRVDITRLDHLMNIVGELVLEKSIIGNIRDKLGQDSGMRILANELYKAHRTLDRKLAELQEAVMNVRMVPVGQLFGRLGRIVRKLSREQKKEIDLIRSGMDTELDKLIIEELADPLMHIIRNAIDHGIESPKARQRRGKQAKGTIELSAFQQGNHVVIQVSDDGAGVDPERVRDKAVRMGLVAPNAELTNEEIFDLLFEPGFSTRETVSELSGRGVGLDVVKRNISNLSGLIQVDSAPGEGTTFTITLPITLAIIQTLIVECAGRTYALPLNSVRECHILKNDDIKTIEQREVMELREQTIPLLRLGALFGYDKTDCSLKPAKGAPEPEESSGWSTPSRAGINTSSLEPVPEEFAFALDSEKDLEGKHFVVVVGIADKRMGVLVDRMVGRQDVVIKSLGRTLGDIRGVAGATDLGNQQTVLVLDVGDLLGEIGHGPEKGAAQLQGV